MGEQLPLGIRPKTSAELEEARDFARTHTHQGDESTSAIAAESVVDTARAHRAMIYGVLREAGVPLCATDIAKICRLDTLQVMKRISDLRGAGVVVVVDHEGITESGRKSCRYRVKAAALKNDPERLLHPGEGEG